MTNDTTIVTRSGATLLVPKGWWLTQEGETIVLEDPDRALTATLLDTSESDAVTAIGASWQRVQPGFALKPQHAPESPPPSRGWDAVTNVVYQTRVQDHRVVTAIARRFGGTTYVALVEGDSAAHARRRSQLNTALWTLQPKGMHEESFVGKTPRPFDDSRATSLDAFIVRTLAQLDVPGASISVVQGDKVVYEKGFGVRVLGRRDPVTPNSLFMMGSITKPMTTMMEATLVDAGKFGWDTPVTKLLPTFVLGDADITSKMAMWHTACACTGMPEQDLEAIFDFANVSPEQYIASMKTMKPTTAFGETFQYSNPMVAAGGYAAAHAYDSKQSLGDAYRAVMRRNIFGPIGMKSTTLDFAAAQRADHAMPHALAIDGVLHSIPLAMERAVVLIAP
ncbi:MAG: serine hydrolase domain-containing protein, partial [Verrucomicrobiota bacterium]